MHPRCIRVIAHLTGLDRTMEASQDLPTPRKYSPAARSGIDTRSEQHPNNLLPNLAGLWFAQLRHSVAYSAHTRLFGVLGVTAVARDTNAPNKE